MLANYATAFNFQIVQKTQGVQNKRTFPEGNENSGSYKEQLSDLMTGKDEGDKCREVSVEYILSALKDGC